MCNVCHIFSYIYSVSSGGVETSKKDPEATVEVEEEGPILYNELKLAVEVCRNHLHLYLFDGLQNILFWCLIDPQEKLQKLLLIN